MHWADIVAAIKKEGSSLAAIARQEDVSPSLVTGVIRGTAVSHKVAYAIAATTGIPTERMWPGKYLTPASYTRARKGNSRGRLPEVSHA